MESCLTGGLQELGRKQQLIAFINYMYEQVRKKSIYVLEECIGLITLSRGNENSYQCTKNNNPAIK